MIAVSASKLAATDLNNLMRALEIDVVALTGLSRRDGDDRRAGDPLHNQWQGTNLDRQWALDVARAPSAHYQTSEYPVHD
jgi:hypothetical protein